MSKTSTIIYFLQLSRVKDVEKDKDELEAIKNEAVEFLKAENKKLELTHQLHQIAKLVLMFDCSSI